MFWLWLWLGWLGCPKPTPPDNNLINQLEAEIRGLQEHQRQCELKLQEYSACDCNVENALYTELKKVLPPDQVEVYREGAATRLVIQLSQIFSDPYKLTFRVEGDQSIVLVATALQLNPEMQVMIVGHTSDRQLPKYWAKVYGTQIDWSSKLASTLAARFVEQFQCDASRFTIAGRGEYSPRESNDTDAGRDRNQRLEIWIYPPKSPPPNPG